MTLRNLTIGKRAAICFSFITLIMLLIGLFCLSRMAELNRVTQHINGYSLSGIATLETISSNVAALRIESIRIRSSTDPQIQAKSEALMSESRDNLARELQRYKTRTGVEEGVLASALEESDDIPPSPR
jgi:methyl-accepting chemotaxis protein